MTNLKNKLFSFGAAHKKGIFVWAVILASGFMIFKGVMQIPQINANKTEIASLKEQIEYEKTRQKETESLMTQVDSDEYIERVASEKLGLVKSNSKIFIDVSQEQQKERGK